MLIMRLGYLFSFFKIKTFIVFFLVLLCTACEKQSVTKQQDLNSTENAFSQTIVSKGNSFTINLITEKGIALPVNQLHNWIISVNDFEGKSVFPAVFSIAGGMPAHGHGLPTQPVVTEHLGEGRYLLEGVKFNMDGQWIMKFQIIANNKQDIAEITFDVSY